MFVGGKGGVGKTTCAAAYAVAATRAGRRVLLVSTDPAHSLGDALGVRLSSRACTVRGTAGRLQAIELDAPRAFARWLGEHRRALGEILEHGTWLDHDDVNALLGLSIPGIDELLGMIEITRLAARESVETLVIVDTAPTGHTLHLFAAPEVVGAVASVLMDLQHEHRMIREQLARVGRPETADRLIDLLGEQARDTAALLGDARRTALEWVMLPERLSLAETEDALRILDARHMNVSTIVVNRVLPDGQACPICDSRRGEEARVIAVARRTIARRRTIRMVAAQRIEPRGIRALGIIGRSLSASNSNAKRRTVNRVTAAISVSQAGAPAQLSMADFRGVRLVFVGGKGGVGKTTIAAALATTLASRDRERRVLLLSTDPAHSLGDVFSAAVGDKAVPIPGGPVNLLVREIDAAAALRARRKEFESALQEITGTVGADDLVAADGVSKLVELAPPGIDELFGFISVTDSLKSDSETLLVIDTAPTGHALRLLELPDAARSWVQALLRILLKYRNLSRPGQLAADLVDLSQSIRSLQDLVRDSRLARFLVVTRAAELPRLETVRLLRRLKRLRLSVPAAIVNARTLAPGGCSICRATASAEQRQVAQLKRECRRVVRDCAIIQTPLTAPPPRGAKALERWAHTWTR